MSDTSGTERRPGRVRRSYRVSLWATGLLMASVAGTAVATRDWRGLLGLPGLAIAFLGLQRSGAHLDAVRELRLADSEAEFAARQATISRHQRAELLWGLLALVGIALTLVVPALLT